MKPKIIAALLGSAFAFSAFAADYYVVVPVKGRSAPVTPVAVGFLDAAAGTDFGELNQNQTGSLPFTFSNKGSKAAAGVYARISATPGLSLSGNTCGTAANPISLGAGQSCGLSVNYVSADAAQLSNAYLSVEGDFQGTPSSVGLTGRVGGFNTVASWASGTNGNLGGIEVGTNTTRRFQAVKSGANGTLSMGAVMTGDVSQFQIAAVGTSLSGGWTCASGGVIASDKASFTTCKARSTSGALANVEFDIKYAPTVLGAHQVTVTPFTDNGSGLPAPLVVKGSSNFNSAAGWAAGTSGAYGTIENATTLTKRFTMNNTGAYGALAVGFTASGDVSQFKIVRMGRSLSGNWGCVSGGAVAANGLSVAPCKADVAGNGALSNLDIEVMYAPTTTGTHSLVLTPNTNNGTVLPANLTLTASSAFNPTAAWVAGTSGVYASQAVGTSVTKRFTMNNTGAYGALSVGFTMTGDVNQFKIVRMGRSLSGSWGCVSGGVVAADKQSVTACKSSPAGSGALANLDVEVTYAPTSAGSHSISLVPITDNGTTLPAVLSLTGSAN